MEEQKNLNISGEEQDIIAPQRTSAPATSGTPAPAPKADPSAPAQVRRRPVMRPVQNPRPAPGAARPAMRPVQNPRPAPGATRPAVNPQPAPGATRPAVNPQSASAQPAEQKTRAIGAAVVPVMPQPEQRPQPATPAEKESAPAPQKKAAKKPAARKATLSERRKKQTADGEKIEIRDRGGVSTSILKALIYIAFVLIVSGFLAVYGIRAANDVFAFVKDDVSVEVSIPSEASLDEVSHILYDNGLIEDANWFKWYTGFKYRDKELNFVGGVHTLSSAMNYNAMIAELTPKSGRTIVTVTIPEGYTVDEIIDIFLEKGIGTREGFVDAIQNYEYSYQFIDVLNSIELSENRKYRLEGYLFPDTYDFYSDSSEVAIIDKMLANFQYRFEESDYDRCLALGMNLDEVITLASIIQEEAHYSSDMYYISAVFHNRLNNSAQFPCLQSDATVQYALPEHKEHLTSEDLQVDSPYNTHIYKGLPPGAICNPGLDAITAALYPEDYLAESGQKSYYFIAGNDGYSLYAATYEGHLRNQATVEAQKAG